MLGVQKKSQPVQWLNLLLLIITLVAFPFISSITILSEQVQFAIILIVFTFLGLPHGSMDHIIFRKLRDSQDEKSTTDKAYIYSSILKMVLFALVWFISPLIGFVAFILMSAYHFGESQLYSYLPSENRKVSQLLYLLWGVTLLCSIMIIHLESTQKALFSIFPYFTQEHDFYKFIESNALFLFLGLQLANLFGFIYLFINKFMKTLDFVLEILILFSLICVFYYTPLFIGFIFYFGVWHSIKAMQQIFMFRSKKGASYTIKKYYKETFLYSILTLFGLIGIIIIDRYFNLLGDYTLLFFILISILTAPHFLLFGKMIASIK
ncbi:Brp/Blh family beta-carotene 15,15'-dioxygenase [Aquimarina sp. ERC-38]|uniref:Brp/Blh family beta-carotene 15,15'-dioxygenase n=1 Tax=Aquimarina sp. ERC-38 TaxID=2949996 RepID=UPI0022451F41|nr:Brp/Blh family beta-carotene 15,15'-dioxygenase [Aquimarina sp. ERC-38]UZO82283.1 Brp/Blh family beta-carotene 15,15'-dioxygenase [Aquimarina sp. ERC-38]